MSAPMIDIDNPKDWRGTPIKVGSRVVYHVVTKGGKTVEGEVRAITEGNPYTGLTIMVQPEKESGIAVARAPFFYPRSDRGLRAVEHLKVTVIG